MINLSFDKGSALCYVVIIIWLIFKVQQINYTGNELISFTLTNKVSEYIYLVPKFIIDRFFFLYFAQVPTLYWLVSTVQSKNIGNH